MPSQKQSKRRRHEPVAPRPPRARTHVAVPSAPGGRRASPKVLLLVGGAIAAVIVAVLLGVTLSGGSSASSDVPAVGSLQGGLSGAADVRQMFKGIPQEGNNLGSP